MAIPDVSSANLHDDRAERATARFASFGLLGEADRAALMTLAGTPETLKRGAFLTHEGDADHRCFLLLEGWTASTISFADGARAIIKVHMAGDMLGSPSMALVRSADTLMALTSCVVTPLSLAGMGRLFENNPRLAAILFLIAQEERVMLMDRLASAARGDALAKVAFVLLQLHHRALRNQAADDDGFELPLSQADFADVAGLTTVHTNRMLQQLRRAQVATWDRGRVMILDHDKLRSIADLPSRQLARNLNWLPKDRGE